MKDLVSLERVGTGRGEAGGGVTVHLGEGVTTPVGFEGVGGACSLLDRLTGTPIALTLLACFF